MPQSEMMSERFLSVKSVQCSQILLQENCGRQYSLADTVLEFIIFQNRQVNFQKMRNNDQPYFYGKP